MGSQSSPSRAQTARYPALVYFILIAVVYETVLAHVKATSEIDKLKLRINELEKQQRITKYELAHLRSAGPRRNHFCIRQGPAGIPGATGQKGQKGEAGKPCKPCRPPPKDCSNIRGSHKSGIYTINPDGKKPFRVFCDMQTSTGGWTVIQRRMDGSVDFYKNWVDYKIGFGKLNKEFWLGNEKIHRLTKHRNMMIRFDLEDFDGNKRYAEYKVFYIDGENANYKLHVSSYSGTAGDSFTYHNGMQFSTKDRDHDIFKGNCATRYHGAWWYKNCHASNLNGKYLRGPHKSYADGVIWYHFRGHHYSLKKTEMKVRPAK